MSESAAVLFANDAFYAAFQSRDLEAMDGLWASAAPVACIHPGWPALSGREDVMDSWRSILNGDSPPDIRCRNAEAFVHGESAFVICYELVGGGVLVASNLFVREEGQWRMVHHQAGPVNMIPDSLKEPEETGPLQ